MIRVYNYSLRERMSGLFVGSILILVSYFFVVISNKSLYLTEGMIEFYLGILLFGLIDALLRGSFGTPRRVVFNGATLVIEGWTSTTELPLSSIVLIELEQGQAFLFRMYRDRLGIYLDSGRKYRLNGSFINGAGGFVEEIKNSGIKVKEI